MGDWIRQIVILVLIAAFLDLLLPSGSMDRYVKLVMGLLIVMAMLSPVFRLLDREPDLAAIRLKPDTDPPVESMENIQSRGEQMEEAANRQVRDEAERRLESTLSSEVAGKFKVEVVKADVTMSESRTDDMEIKQVELRIRSREPEASPAEQETVRPVEPVNIMVGSLSDGPDAAGKSEETEQTRRIARWVAEYLGLSESLVTVTEVRTL